MLLRNDMVFIIVANAGARNAARLQRKQAKKPRHSVRGGSDDAVSVFGQRALPASHYPNWIVRISRAHTPVRHRKRSRIAAVALWKGWPSQRRLVSKKGRYAGFDAVVVQQIRQCQHPSKPKAFRRHVCGCNRRLFLTPSPDSCRGRRGRQHSGEDVAGKFLRAVRSTGISATETADLTPDMTAKQHPYMVLIHTLHFLPG